MIDSHCHLADDAFVSDLGDVVARAKAAGLDRVLCILDASSDEELQRAADLSARWPDVRFGLGVHPHQAGKYAEDPDVAARVAGTALDAVAGVRALGEVGLDYHYDFAPREVQQRVFAAQVRLALARNLPVIIHTREADADTLAILRDAGETAVRGVFHCFTGDAALAEAALDLGFYLSFSGIVTFPKAQALRDVAAATPADRLLVETDSPYLSPVPHRGGRNEPARVVHVADALAAVRGVTPDAFRAQTTANFERLFSP
jgi:TatD DNase family protein